MSTAHHTIPTTDRPSGIASANPEPVSTLRFRRARRAVWFAGAGEIWSCDRRKTIFVVLYAPVS
jgi:hypothetical protein